VFDALCSALLLPEVLAVFVEVGCALCTACWARVVVVLASAWDWGVGLCG
jgi:hypothetical protein